ncbi:MAG: cytochrome c biogenesis protein CcsA, partial [Thermoguttaceae bacterium]|nr:cytochrome c biogenesis protein CcsA [Thermoguttaceae bacterium]
EFNPNIRPLVAVLRSNFWLTIHVLAIIVSYALGAIAWVVALTSLASYIFGRYGVRVPIPGARPVQERPARDARRDRERGKGNAADRDRDRAPFVYEFEPEYARKTAPVIATMTRSAVLFLLAGIILGARWADFSWGRFWSWDPKEVWALVTLLIYLVVLHVNKISGGKRFVMALGANFGALAIIMTWYGLSFVMGGGGRHAYASGESNKIAVLYILFAVNIGWACLAIARYWFERARRRKRF